MTIASTSPRQERILAFAAERQPFAKRDLYKAMPDATEYQLDQEIKALLEGGGLDAKGKTIDRVFYLPDYSVPDGVVSPHRHREENAIARVVARAKANDQAPALNGHEQPAITVELDQEVEPRRRSAPEQPSQGLTPAQRRYAEDVLAAAKRPVVEPGDTMNRDLRLEYFDVLIRLAASTTEPELGTVLDRIERLIAA